MSVPKGIPRYQINNARLALSLSFRCHLQYISRLRARGLALLICYEVSSFSFLACLEVARLVKLARLTRLAWLVRLG